ncbi:MAG: hypothetical protein WCJ46_05205 [bacterium]
MAKTIKNKKTEHTAACVSCGMLINESQQKIINHKHYCKYCAPEIQEILKPPTPAALPLFVAPVGVLRVLTYIVCIFSPLIGFVLGMLYISQADQENKKFGKKCFIFMGIGIAFWGIVFIVNAFFDLMLLGSKAAGMFGFKIGEGYY